MVETQVFIKLFRQAVDKVEAGFYDRSEWGGVNYAKPGAVRNHIIHFGERAFCYELYYHCRVLMEQHYQETQTYGTVRLQAELKKSQIADIIEEKHDVRRLDRDYYPDFLLHGPGIGDFLQQKVVVEIKATPNLSRNNVLQDLCKLEQFIDRYNYEQGIFLAINVDMSRLREMIEAENRVKDISHPEKIIILAKKCHQRELEECKLSDLTSTKHSERLT